MEQPVIIDILMATYNGVRYLRQQIQSVQNQTYPHWRLWIHDDGSNDGTLALLEHFAAEDPRINLVRDQVCLHSASENFMHLLACSTADFTICCDQDDIWLEDKLEVLYEEIRKRDNSRPVAVYSNGYMYHCDRGVIQGRSVLTPPHALEDIFFLNGGIQGCAILFNRRMREICQDRPEYVVMHDHLFTLVALTFGEFVYVDRFTMLYRRHASTVTDAAVGDFREKTSAFVRKKNPVLDRSHYEALRSFYLHYQTRMPASRKQAFEIFFALENLSLVQKIWHVCRNHFTLYNRPGLLLAKLLMRPYLGDKGA